MNRMAIGSIISSPEQLLPTHLSGPCPLVESSIDLDARKERAGPSKAGRRTRDLL